MANLYNSLLEYRCLILARLVQLLRGLDFLFAFVHKGHETGLIDLL